MKNTFVILFAALFLTTTSCKKSTDGNKNVVAGTESAAADQKTVRYVAEDGSSALITFNKDGNSISVRSNGRTITVPQSQVQQNTTVYSGNGIEVKSEGDNITITQNNAVISLKKAKGE